MMNYQKRLYRVIALLIISLVVTVLVASLALAKRDASIYPGNLSAGPVDLGNLTRAEALHKLENITESLEIVFVVSHGHYPMKLRDMGVQLNAEATINKIDAIMENWSLLDHSIHRGKNQVVIPVWEYDFAKLHQSLNNLALSTYREAVDARLLLHGDQLLYCPEKEGSQIDAQLSASLMTESLNKGQFKVVLPEKFIKPALTSLRINQVKELLSVQAVPVKGDYWQGINNEWAVPGKVILPGESAYINIIIDPSAENAENGVEAWHEALTRSAFEAGLVYDADDMQMHNPTNKTAALFITRENDLWLIRIYGQQNEAGKKITLSRTYAPFLTDIPEKESERIQKIYRHEFVGNKLQNTELLGKVPLVHIGRNSDDNTIDNENTQYK
jgi:hypothetical protein